MTLFAAINNETSEVAQQLAKIMGRLNQEPGVIYAVLSTEDGLALEQSATIAPRLAAVAGFILATVRQSWAMLGVNATCHENIALQTDGSIFVCHLLEIHEVRLILAVLFKNKAPYKRLIGETTGMIQQILGGQSHL